MYLYYVILIVMTAIVCIIASRSEMLRNSIFNQANFDALAASMKIKKPRAAFSLSRSQLAFWTVIIVSSFLYLLIFDSSPTSIIVPTLTGVTLALLGISGGTTIVAQAIDGSQKDNSDDSNPPAQQDYPSKNFLTDIISDDKGVSLHRLQNVIWTLVIGGTYIAYIATSKKFPDDTVITTTMLGLMGISTGTYLGLKNSENNAVPDNGTPTPSGSGANNNSNSGNNSNANSNINTNQNTSTDTSANADQNTTVDPGTNTAQNSTSAQTGVNTNTVSAGDGTTVNGSTTN